MKPIHYDIAVIGGGSAGLAAAVGAARHGARVCLIEREHTLGGNATSAQVGTICGLARCGVDAPLSPIFDNPGFAAEFSKLVGAASKTSLLMNNERLTYLPYRIASLGDVTREMLRETPDISPCLGATLISIAHRSTREFQIVLGRGDQGMQELRANAVIDASGDAVVSQALGLPPAEPHPPQAASLIFELHGLPDLDERSVSFLARKILREANLEGSLPLSATYISIVPGSLMRETALFKLGIAHPPDQNTSESLQREALKEISALVECLRTKEPRFRSIRHTATAPRLGVRSGKRGIGQELLSDETVRLSKRHIKGIALGLWPAEVWMTPAHPTVSFPELGNSYEIPLGSLCAHGAPGVYFAGRTISASDYAIASARVIGTCLSTGYAAGRLAAGELQQESVDAIVSSIRAEQVDPYYELSQGLNTAPYPRST